MLDAGGRLPRSRDWLFPSIYSGALVARRSAKRSSIIIETGPHLCIEIGTHVAPFLMVKMANGMDYG